MLLSVRLFHAPITPQLVIAVALVGTSTLQYNLPKAALLGEWDADTKEEESKQLMGCTPPSSIGEDEERRRQPRRKGQSHGPARLQEVARANVQRGTLSGCDASARGL